MLLRSFIRLNVLALALGVACIGAAQTPLSNDSPFLSAGAGAAKADAANADFELAGVSVTKEGIRVCIYNTQAKRSRWMSIGETEGPVQVVSYDAKSDGAQVRVNGILKTLQLRKAVIGGGPATGVPTISFTIPQAPGPPGPAGPPTPAGKTAETVKQEQDARMLVSDLLEIGIRQRKAYEEAKAKADAEASGQKPAGGDHPPGPGGLTPQP